jgi:malic enzyme
LSRLFTKQNRTNIRFKKTEITEKIMKKSDIIIIGGGAAGIVAINTIHALNSKLSLTLI